MISSDMAVIGLLNIRGVKGLVVSFGRLLTRRHVRSTMRNLLMTRFSACLGELQMKAPFLGARPIKMRLAVHALGILKAQLK